MEVKIDAKCPRCGALIQFHHVSPDSKTPEMLNKTFEIGRASSLTSALRKVSFKKIDDDIIKKSALEEIMGYINDLFRVIGHTEGKKELLALRKQIAKSRFGIKKKIEDEFKQGKAELLKEIDKRLKEKKKDRKGLAYRGLFDGRPKQ